MAHPNAALAEKIARAALERGQKAKALNWAERVPQSPGVTTAQLNWVTKLRADLRWQLTDAGVGVVQLRITPAHADVLVDGMHVPFHNAVHNLWLPEGVHHIEVLAADHAGFFQSVGAVRGERQLVEVELEATKLPDLVVHSKPDSEVYLDGIRVGVSTRGTFAVSSGQHSVEFRADGYLPWRTQIKAKRGEVSQVTAELTKAPIVLSAEEMRRAKQVDRPLMPIETREKKDMVFIKPVASGSTLDKDMGQALAPDAASPESARKAREAAATAGPKPVFVQQGETVRPEPHDSGLPTEVSHAKEEPRAFAGPERNEVEEPAKPSGPGLSRTAKGWIYGGAGAAALGAGLALSYLGAADAETANQLPRGAKTYADDYAAAAGKTYIGYGAAGLGAVGMGIGAYYLFGEGGLGRSGKGWVVTTLGTLTAAAGSWLMIDAMTLANNTDTNLAPSNPEYTRRFDLAERNRWIGLGVVGAGAALIGTGVALIATAPSSSAQAEHVPTQQTAQRWQIQPWLASGATGATFALGW